MGQDSRTDGTPAVTAPTPNLLRIRQTVLRSTDVDDGADMGIVNTCLECLSGYDHGWPTLASALLAI
jgi:hypothetical protein